MTSWSLVLCPVRAPSFLC